MWSDKQKGWEINATTQIDLYNDKIIYHINSAILLDIHGNFYNYWRSNWQKGRKKAQQEKISMPALIEPAQIIPC